VLLLRLLLQIPGGFFSHSCVNHLTGVNFNGGDNDEESGCIGISAGEIPSD
jgi:hypothetical protein